MNGQLIELYIELQLLTATWIYLGIHQIRPFEFISHIAQVPWCSKMPAPLTLTIRINSNLAKQLLVID